MFTLNTNFDFKAIALANSIAIQNFKALISLKEFTFIFVVAYYA